MAAHTFAESDCGFTFEGDLRFATDGRVSLGDDVVSFDIPDGRFSASVRDAHERMFCERSGGGERQLNRGRLTFDLIP